MKRFAPVVLVAALLFVWWLWPRRLTEDGREVPNQGPPSARENQPVVAVTEIHPVNALRSPLPQSLLGETILSGYAKTNFTPEHDLTLLSHLMENSVLLLKSAANRPLGGNEDWARFLIGRNAAHERFLPATHVALDAQGRLVDRWKSPLFIHALGGGRFEIRSAGPDKTMWTDDDLQRNPDGTFAHGHSSTGLPVRH